MDLGLAASQSKQSSLWHLGGPAHPPVGGGGGGIAADSAATKQTITKRVFINVNVNFFKS